MIDINQKVHDRERGFVLPTSLVMLVLLTTLSIATYYGTIISQQTSATAQDSTQAFYYAETGLNYVAWAMKNDAELDGYEPLLDPIIAPTGIGGALAGRRIDHLGNVILQPYVVGDRREWAANRGNPSNFQSIQAVFSGDSASFINVYGQLGYFDNRDLYSRPVSLHKNAVGLSQIYSFGVAQAPSFRDLYAQLGGYIRLDIDAYGQIKPMFSDPRVAAQHAGPNPKDVNIASRTCDETGDVPCNGAIVWLTAGDSYTDYVLYPIDPYVAAPLLDVYGRNFSTLPLTTPPVPFTISNACFGDIKNCASNTQVTPALQSICFGNLGNCISYSSPAFGSIDVYSNGVQKQVLDPFPVYYQGLPCDFYTYTKTDVACEQPVDAAGKLSNGVGHWKTDAEYGLVLYAVGYSNGKARKMIRMLLHPHL